MNLRTSTKYLFIISSIVYLKLYIVRGFRLSEDVGISIGLHFIAGKYTLLPIVMFYIHCNLIHMFENMANFYHNH